jgi:hypothetical protein
MSEQKIPPGDAGGGTAAAPGRPIPEQVVREPVTAPDEVRPAVPEQAVAPAQEALPAQEAAPVEEAPPEHRRRLRRRKPRRQSAFRRWRKTRPFWGGVFTMLGGIEIAALTAASYELLFVSRSVGFAIAVGAAIAAFGLTMWLSPVLSKLLGLLTLIAALLSFVTSNLGGFLLGMLLAILGGGLSFAWEPGLAVEEPATDEGGREPSSERRTVVPGQRSSESVEEYEPLDTMLEE